MKEEFLVPLKVIDHVSKMNQASLVVHLSLTVKVKNLTRVVFLPGE